jgi:cytosine deaminase
LIYQFRFKQVIVGDRVNAQGGVAWLRQQGLDILDLASPECIEMLGKFQKMNPQLWDECIGEG